MPLLLTCSCARSSGSRDVGMFVIHIHAQGSLPHNLKVHVSFVQVENMAAGVLVM